MKIACSACGGCRGAHPGRRQPLAGRRHRALLDAPLPEGPGPLGAVVPGRLHHRVVPGPVPQLVLLDARDEHRAPPRGALPDHPGLRHGLWRGRPADAQELGQRHRVRRGGRADGRRRHALDVRPPAARGQHPVRLPRGQRGAPGAARAVERGRVPGDLRPPRGLDTGRRGRRGRGSRGRGRAAAGRHAARPLDRVARRGARGREPGVAGGLRRACRDPRHQYLHRRPVAVVPAALAATPVAQRRRGGPGRRVRDAPPRARVAGPGLRAHPAVPGRGAVPGAGRGAGRGRGVVAPDSVHLTRWPDADLARLRDEPLEAAMADLRRAVDLGRTLRASAGIKVRQPLARLWLALPGGRLGGGEHRPGRRGGAARPARRRPERALRDPHRRRLGPRRAAGQGAAADPRPARQGCHHPRGHGRGPRQRGRVPARWRRPPGGSRARRGRGGDPGDTAAGHGRRRRRRHRHGHRHDPHGRPARRGRRPGADARAPGPAPAGGAGARRPHRGVAGRGRSDRRAAGAAPGRRSRPTSSRMSSTRALPPDWVERRGRGARRRDSAASGCASRTGPGRHDDRTPRGHVARPAPVAGVRGHRRHRGRRRPGIQGVGPVELRARVAGRRERLAGCAHARPG